MMRRVPRLRAASGFSRLQPRHTRAYQS